MTTKFNIPEKDELTLLNYWRDNFAYTKIPNELKNKITEEQSTKLFAHYSDLGSLQKEIDDRIKEIENKFQKEKEQSFFYLLRRYFKEHLARTIIWIVLGFIVGFVWNKLFTVK